MKYNQTLEELRNEPVTPGAMESTMSAVLTPQRRAKPSLVKRGLPFAIGIVAVVGFSVYPWRKTDQLWAQAKASLMDAKIIHMKIQSSSMMGSGEVWIHGKSVFESNKWAEYRSNGKVMTQRVGQVSSYKSIDHTEGIYMRGVTSFEQARSRISAGQAKRITQIFDGKSYSTYSFSASSIVLGDGKTNSGVVGELILTAFVDEKLGKIVRIEQRTEVNKSRLAAYTKHHPFTLGQDWVKGQDMSVWIDYPTSIDDSMFEPPADAFDQKENKSVVAKMLGTSIQEAKVGDQTVMLHGIMFDGAYASVIWSGSAADYQSKDRFRIEGVSLGESLDVRCMSSAKKVHPDTAAVPYCLQRNKVDGTMPKTVILTMPVFAPDPTKPYDGKKGFHSKKIGEVTFRDVPVTPCLDLHMYERQFGLVKHWW